MAEIAVLKSNALVNQVRISRQIIAQTLRVTGVQQIHRAPEPGVLDAFVVRLVHALIAKRYRQENLDDSPVTAAPADASK